jgi:hypothetical protein
MVIPIVPIVVAIILLALVWWVTREFAGTIDPFLMKVIRVVIVVLIVLWILSALTGIGPTVSFR